MREVSTSQVVLLGALYYEVYILASNTPKLQKGSKPQQNKFLSLLLNNQKEILKRGLTLKKQKPKCTTLRCSLEKIEAIKVFIPSLKHLCSRLNTATLFKCQSVPQKIQSYA